MASRLKDLQTEMEKPHHLNESEALHARLCFTFSKKAAKIVGKRPLAKCSPCHCEGPLHCHPELVSGSCAVWSNAPVARDAETSSAWQALAERWIAADLKALKGDKENISQRP